VSGSARPLLNDEGTNFGAVVDFRDVHAETLAREALAESERRFRLTMESAPVGMAVLDLDRHFLEVNPKLSEMVGCDAEWLLARQMQDILDPVDNDQDLRHRAEVLVSQELAAPWECRIIRADGRTIWVEHSLGLLRDDSGMPLSYVATFVDVTETRAAKERLMFQATHDLLTRLVNRADLFNQAREVMGHVQRTGERVAALYVDVDDLKSINDTFGHAAGDQALVAIARKLTASCRDVDIVSRIGGDEFAILLPGLHSIGDAESVARKILTMCDAPIEIDGSMIKVQVSIGVALAEPNDGAEVTLRHADAALYQAKAAGRGRIVSHVDFVAG
jgi:diguanylate cyclase (GGDEF)-like protein/PAS domain S-box-containing protein